MLSALADIDVRTVNHDSFAVRIGIDKIIPDKEPQHDEIGIVLESVFFQHRQFFAGMRAGIAGVDDVDLMRANATLEHRLKQSRVVTFRTSGPAERISYDHNPENTRRFLERII